MRLLVIVLTILLFAGFLFFLMDNLETSVEVKLFETLYPDVQLFSVVLASLLAGMLYVGIIAVAEGAHVRLVNRRLSREMQKLEGELNYLRTQRAGTSRQEPDAVDASAAARTSESSPPERPAEDLPSAPVYDADGEWSGDDEDAYSGGRAV